jgi:SAM-dependent methyltransferase
MSAAAFDWGLGRYERTAEQLAPAAHAVVETVAPAAGEHVVDVGTGTGNAALLAARSGARVTGVDPAPRLLEVARERAAALGVGATFAVGEAASLPLADEEADAVLSVFGVIFAPDPAAAAVELARVTAPGGRIVLSAWLPEGAIREAVVLARRTVQRVLGAPDGPPPFAWHDRDALGELFAPHGFAVTLDVHSLAFTGASSRAFHEEQADHPLAVAGRAVLERSGEQQALDEAMIAIYEAGNEDPAAFRATTRYVVATARRPA